MNDAVFIIVFELKSLASSRNLYFKRNASNQFIRLFVDEFNFDIRLNGRQIDADFNLTVLRLCSGLCSRHRFRLRLHPDHL